MSESSKKQSAFWFAVFAVSNLAYTYIQDDLRPNDEGDSETFQYLMGIGPNLFAAISVPSLFMITLPYLLKSSDSEKSRIKMLVLSASVSLLGLSVWEVVQITTNNGFFDPHDLYWTGIGTIVFVLLGSTLKS